MTAAEQGAEGQQVTIMCAAAATSGVRALIGAATAPQALAARKPNARLMESLTLDRDSVSQRIQGPTGRPWKSAAALGGGADMHGTAPARDSCKGQMTHARDK